MFKRISRPVVVAIGLVVAVGLSNRVPNPSGTPLEKQFENDDSHVSGADGRCRHRLAIGHVPGHLDRVWVLRCVPTAPPSTVTDRSHRHEWEE